jgi:hypothetical protein
MSTDNFNTENYNQLMIELFVIPTTDRLIISTKGREIYCFAQELAQF